jgi:hypothetical protein
MNPSILNNQAVVKLQQGKHDEAVSLLTDALNMLASLMRSQESSVIDATNPSTNGGAAFVFLSNANTSPFLENNMPKSSVFHRYIFRVPICVHNSDQLLLDCRSYEMLSFVVIYNLALTWHLHGVLTVGNDSLRNTRLHRALSLYQHANSIMTNCRTEAVTLLYMAIVCNIGHIYGCLGEDAKAKDSSQLLLSAILCLVDSGADPEHSIELEGFISNVMPIILKQASAAAA